MSQAMKMTDNFNKSIQYEPSYENAYANRGIVYLMQGKMELAMQDLNKALQLNPKYIEALVNRGIAYAQTKQFDKAIADFTMVTTLTRKIDFVLHSIGMSPNVRKNKPYTDIDYDYYHK